MLKRFFVLVDVALMFFVALTVHRGKRKALIVVDFQNDFADPNGSLSVAGALTILWVINLIIWISEQLGWLIIFTRDAHPEKTSHFKCDENPDGWPVHCVFGTWGYEFYARLYVPNSAFQVFKGRKAGENAYSGFDGTTELGHHTTLDLLERYQTEVVYVCGLALDYCVKATCLSSVVKRFITYLVSFATCAVNIKPDDGAKALAELKAAGVKKI
ncbi:MAG: isochorismatase family protein [Candidatus Vogelbacteria bacterium]|nr:isochorismatase family protein [Candidatus Vogelbacteria bacterium]